MKIESIILCCIKKMYAVVTAVKFLLVSGGGSGYWTEQEDKHSSKTLGASRHLLLVNLEKSRR